MQVVQISCKLLVNPQHYFARSQVGLEIDFQVCVGYQFSFPLLEAADTGQFALFLSGFCFRPALDARAHLPMVILSAILVLEVIEEAGLKQHEPFEAEMIDGKIRMDCFHDTA